MNLTLYDQDYYKWLEQTATAISTGQWNEVDIANLVEEIKDMGKSEKRALESNLTVILLDLLKYKYQPTHRSNSWLSSILEHRLRIKKQIKESPSLRPYLEQVFEECYNDARLRSAVETGLVLTTFPTENPFNVELCLDINYLPESEVFDL